MFIFLRLLLAHFIGDFPLQFNKVYSFKLAHKGPLGALPHSLLIFVSLILFSWPYLDLPDMWIFLVFIAGTHLLQDSMKVGLGKIKYGLWLYVLDQVLHVITISCLFLTCLKFMPPPGAGGNPLIAAYNNDALVIYAIMLIIATYNGYYLIRNFKNTFFGSAGTCGTFEKWYGMAERGIIVTLFFFGGYYLFLIPAFLACRLPVFRLCKTRCAICDHFTYPSEITFSLVLGVICGAPLLLL